VIGTTSNVAAAIDEVSATSVLIAIPSAQRDVIARVTAGANERGLVVKVLPTILELIEGDVSVSDIRPLEPVDLLGREPIHTDVESIAAYLTDKRVLVTGAGGSIGSELCRQIARFSPAELVMLDRDESALHAVQLSISGKALLDTSDVVLADIRDRSALARVFADHRPQVVFHSAALKHLPMLEQYPAEGIKTNVFGTLHVLDLAAEFGVERLVNISTDKAAAPTSVLGLTKRVSELITADAGRSRGTGAMLSVRFGNVLGSRGSMLETFTAQVAAGGPVTLTHPEVTRFFMTVSEACELVIQAGAIGGQGEVLILDMGRPVRIADVARQLIAQSGRDIEIVVTGLRPGEKLHETLFSPDERVHRQVHPAISHVIVPELDQRALTLIRSGSAMTVADLTRVVEEGVQTGTVDR
jgi:FlaA1/EpsC-like NDP-sugar epimerase